MKIQWFDLYVFCLNTNQEVQHPQPLNLDFWEFYIVKTSAINRYTDKIGNPDQKKISLNVIRRMAGEPVKWDGLRKKIDGIIDEMSRKEVLIHDPLDNPAGNGVQDTA